jgi:hypothetical protein
MSWWYQSVFVELPAVLNCQVFNQLMFPRFREKDFAEIDKQAGILVKYNLTGDLTFYDGETVEWMRRRHSFHFGFGFGVGDGYEKLIGAWADAKECSCYILSDTFSLEYVTEQAIASGSIRSVRFSGFYQLIA